MLRLDELKVIADTFETKAGVASTTNRIYAGYWLRIALAAEAIAGVTTSANQSIEGYMKRTALALEAKYGGSGAEENESYDGYMKRIVDALELTTGVSVGTVENRFLLDILNLIVSPPDTTAPTISAPGAVPGVTSATLNITTSEVGGTLYWYVGTSATPPTATAFKAGTGATVSGALGVTTIGVQSISTTSVLASSTNYYAYFLHRDAAGNDSTISASGLFTTLSNTENLAQYRGTLTQAGAGAVNVGQLSATPFTATSSTTTLASGTAGHWTLPTDGTTPVPTSAGVTAGLNGGPYVFSYTSAGAGGVSRSGSLTFTMRANTYTVATIAELAAIKASIDGKTVEAAQGATGLATATGASPIDLGSLTLTTGATFTSENQSKPTTVGPISIASSSKITLSHLDIFYDNSAGNDYSVDGTQPAHALVQCNSANACVIDHNTLRSHTGTTTALKVKRMNGIRGTGTGSNTITITNNTFDTLYNAMTLHSSVNVITDNSLKHIYQDGIGGGSYSWDVERNTGTQFEGDYGKQFGVTFTTGTPVAGEIYSNGSGNSQKVIEIVAVDTPGGTINGYYNLFAKPLASEVYTGPSGKQFTVNTSTSAFDGIHGDFFQPLLDTGITGDVTQLVFKDNFVYRTAAFDHSVRQVEQGMQGLLAQANGQTYKWLTIDVQGNVLLGGQDIGITIQNAAAGTLAYNTVVSAEYYTASTNIRIGNSTNIAVYSNVGDNGTDGPVSGNSPYLVDTDPTNSGFTITSKGGVRVTPANVTTNFPLAYTYPQTLIGLAPAVGSAVELASAGALKTDGTLRAKAPPAATLSIIEGAPVTASSATSTTVSTTFTPGAGSNRRIVVAAAWNGSGGSALSCSVVGGTTVAMNQIGIKGSGASLSASNEAMALFELPEASWPTGSSFTITATVTHTGTPTSMGMQAFTLNHSPNAPTPVVSAGGAITAGSLTATITPPSASNLVIGFFDLSTNTFSADWSAGLTKFGATFTYPATPARTMVAGQAIQGNSALTATGNTASGRGMMILTSFAP